MDTEERDLNRELEALRHENERLKVTQAALRLKEEQCRLALQATHAGIWDANIPLQTVWWNDRSYALFGYCIGDTMPGGDTWARRIHPEDHDRVLHEISNRVEQGENDWSVEYRYNQKDDTTVWLRDYGFVLRDATGNPVRMVGAVLDITEHKSTEESLRQSEEKYRKIVETAREGVWVIDAQAQTTLINQKMTELLGYTEEEMLGRHLFDFMDAEGQKFAEENLERRHQGIAEQHDFRFKHKDGSDVWAIVATNPLYDAQGNYAGSLGMLTDITERILLEEQLLQAQKMESIGRLAGGIAHDFNNMLTALFGYTAFAAAKVSDDTDVQEDLRQIQRIGERAAELTRQLLAFARKQIIAPRQINLNELTLNLHNMLQRLLGDDVVFVTVPCENLWTVEADSGQMEQLLVNLCINGREAMPQGGKLTVELANVVLTEADARAFAGLQPGEYVCLRVRDTGKGIEEKMLRYIFEPFFTTKAQGSGLGLAMCHGIVQQSKGHIHVESTLNVGTCFIVYLPRKFASTPVLSAQTLPKPASAGKETVLVVDDEPSVRLLAVKALQQQGYQILEASTGMEALLVSQTYPHTIHLLLTDVMMPEMSGGELAENLLQLRPDIKIIYSSGHTESTIVEQGILHTHISFLQKPYTLRGLLGKVRSVLDQQP